MKILAFAATNSRNSINRALVGHAVARLGDEILPSAEIETLDLNDFPLPIYSIDHEHDAGIPAPAREFFDRIGAADALLVSFAEHNGLATAAWKNLSDWMSRIEGKIWQGKAMVMLAASPGPRAGAGVLTSQKDLAPRFGADLRGVLGIGNWDKAWDADGQTLVRSEDIAALGEALKGFRQPVE